MIKTLSWTEKELDLSQAEVQPRLLNISNLLSVQSNKSVTTVSVEFFAIYICTLSVTKVRQ